MRRKQSNVKDISIKKKINPWVASWTERPDVSQNSWKLFCSLKWLYERLSSTILILFGRFVLKCLLQRNYSVTQWGVWIKKKYLGITSLQRYDITGIEIVRHCALSLSISKLHIRHNKLLSLKLKIGRKAFFVISSLDRNSILIYWCHFFLVLLNLVRFWCDIKGERKRRIYVKQWLFALRVKVYEGIFSSDQQQWEFQSKIKIHLNNFGFQPDKLKESMVTRAKNMLYEVKLPLAFVKFQ